MNNIMKKKLGISHYLKNERYLRLFETAQDGILILNYPQGEIIDANPFILQLLNCEISDVLNKKLWELGFIEDKRQALFLFEELIKKGYVRYENLNLKKSNGQSIDVEFICNSYPVNNDIVIQCNIRDISERVHNRLLEQKLLMVKIKSLNETIECMSAIIESRDPYTAGHQFRVADLSVKIANFLKLSEFQIRGVKLAAMLHDIGKFKVPLELLVKPSALSKEEYNLIRMHPIYGADILKSISFEQDVPRFVLEHHERLDGSGYPNGLKGNQISLEAKIIAVADVMEGITSFRPYRPAMDLKQALKELLTNKGKLYDANIVDACIHIIINDEYQFPAPNPLQKRV
jgi:PAS domain S-box-containing protein/putative nucleotidyltransferase with HDIG domain